MTVLLSLPHPKMIVMCADSRKTVWSTQVDYYTLLPTGKQTIEYASMTKVFPVPGVGCITLWGEVTRAEDGFPYFLQGHLSQVRTIEDSRTLVDHYLRHDLRADEGGEDVGFHIGGFMPGGIPKLYHVFYGWDRPRPEGQAPDYRSYDHSDFLALYNGRNDFVDPIMKLLVELQEQVGVPIFEDDPVQRIALADFVTRYISRFTPEVGGEICTVLIEPNNVIISICNPGGTISRDALRRILSDTDRE